MALDPATIVLVVVAGVAVGILSALFGVGGGILMVPFMVLVLDRGQHVAEGTSLLVIVPTAVAGVLAHRGRGYVSFSGAAWIAVGGIGGAYAGAVVALSLDADLLQMLFGAFLLIAGMRTLRQGVNGIRAERRAMPPR